MKHYFLVLFTGSEGQNFLMSATDGGKTCVRGFENLLEALAFFERTYLSAAVRGGTWSTAAALHFIQFAPVIVRAPRDQQEFIAWVKALEPEPGGKVYGVRGASGRFEGFKLMNTALVEKLRLEGVKPSLDPEKIVARGAGSEA